MIWTPLISSGRVIDKKKKKIEHGLVSYSPKDYTGIGPNPEMNPITPLKSAQMSHLITFELLRKC